MNMQGWGDLLLEILGALIGIAGMSVIGAFLLNQAYLLWQRGRVVRWQAKQKAEREKAEAIAAEKANYLATRGAQDFL